MRETPFWMMSARKKCVRPVFVLSAEYSQTKLEETNQRALNDRYDPSLVDHIRMLM